jgi:UDP-N-acetylglucosamine--N-acetylmuramyl-(pentapeptide) pyrophosphoryl-undecaprenol N-acetylglucosamine transferase
MGGETQRAELPGRVYSQVGVSDFEQLARTADVVVTHAGVGTLLQLLEWGIFPLVVPRLRRRGEHVDDHQCQIGELLAAEGVAHVVDPASLERDDFFYVAGRKVVTASNVRSV